MAGILALQTYSSDSNESEEEPVSEDATLHLKPLPTGDSVASVSKEIALKAAPAVATKVRYDVYISKLLIETLYVVAHGRMVSSSC